MACDTCLQAQGGQRLAGERTLLDERACARLQAAQPRVQPQYRGPVEPRTDQIHCGFPGQWCCLQRGLEGRHGVDRQQLRQARLHVRRIHHLHTGGHAIGIALDEPALRHRTPARPVVRHVHAHPWRDRHGNRRDQQRSQCQQSSLHEASPSLSNSSPA
ncbi:hypothetical protein G6F57_014421 [Rhizopus arrhizus]|nr:hypothetical protein G6F57_014421 [Rhizopus arrhizus]